MGDTALLDYARPPARMRRVRTWHWVAFVFLLFCAFWAFLLLKLDSANVQTFQRSAQHRLMRLQAALEAFRSDNGRYPTSAEGLGALTKQPAGLSSWRGPYIEPGVSASADEWGRPYTYVAPVSQSRAPVVMSLGPDGKAGTSDDIVVGP